MTLIKLQFREKVSDQRFSDYTISFRDIFFVYLNQSLLNAEFFRQQFRNEILK